MSAPRIAIIGAGPGGLTLARILQHNGMQCTIFELDRDRFVRDQGSYTSEWSLPLRDQGLGHKTYCRSKRVLLLLRSLSQLKFLA